MFRITQVVFILSYILLIASCGGNSLKVQSSHTKNTGTVTSMLPAVVPLFYTDSRNRVQFFCTATFIAPKRAITARHCFCWDGVLDRQRTYFTYKKDPNRSVNNVTSILLDETLVRRDAYCKLVEEFSADANQSFLAEEGRNILKTQLSNHDVVIIEFAKNQGLNAHEIFSISKNSASIGLAYNIIGYGRPALSPDHLKKDPTKRWSLTGYVSEVGDVIETPAQKKTFIENVEVRDYYFGTVESGDSGAPLYDPLTKEIFGIASASLNVKNHGLNIFMNLHSTKGRSFITNKTAIQFQ